MKPLNEKINENKESNIIKVELKWIPRYGRSPHQLWTNLILECVYVLNDKFNFGYSRKELVEDLEKSLEFIKKSDKVEI